MRGRGGRGGGWAGGMARGTTGRGRARAGNVLSAATSGPLAHGWVAGFLKDALSPRAQERVEAALKGHDSDGCLVKEGSHGETIVDFGKTSKCQQLRQTGTKHTVLKEVLLPAAEGVPQGEQAETWQRASQGPRGQLLKLCAVWYFAQRIRPSVRDLIKKEKAAEARRPPDWQGELDQLRRRKDELSASADCEGLSRDILRLLRGAAAQPEIRAQLTALHNEVLQLQNNLAVAEANRPPTPAAVSGRISFVQNEAAAQKYIVGMRSQKEKQFLEQAEKFAKSTGSAVLVIAITAGGGTQAGKVTTFGANLGDDFPLDKSQAPLKDVVQAMQVNGIDEAVRHAAAVDFAMAKAAARLKSKKEGNDENLAPVLEKRFEYMEKLQKAEGDYPTLALNGD